MTYSLNSRLPGIHELRCTTPTARAYQYVSQGASQIRAALNGNDSRFIVICGPCSIHSRDAALRYAENLESLSRAVSDGVILIMRTYFEKPRTQYAWKGFFHQPSVCGELDLATGIALGRQILIEIVEMGVSTGTEILSPSLVEYYEDLISWGCIGARTVESQTHRELASSMNIPIG